ncbi:response regulator transcription factor [Anaerosporobacter faecicola]|uniref:response regulator transcription factor n=1 Tax=Anaerosporobacter faecicola TaxID=2718714 RepID=UPI001439C01D|nr:response regulator transcription factor [Anaerosporobacter faecicola]
MANILIADDEKEIIKLLRMYIEKEGVTVYEAYDGEMAYMILKNYTIDLAIIDIMMPKLNGFDLIKRVRRTMDVPIMVISAKVDLSDRVLGLELGADDYITKPFEPLEVAAKVKARLRRIQSMGGKEAEDTITVGEVVLHLKECVLYKKNEVIPLTKVEYMVLKMFMENPGRVFTKEQIYENAWGDDYVMDDNSIRVIISRLREKLGGDYITTIRGLGYRLEKHE